MPALEVSRGDNLKRIDVQRLVGNDPLQAAIFVLERSHLRDVADVHTAKLRFPLVESRATNAEFTADIGGLGAGLRLLDRRDDLAFGESGFLHVRLLVRREPQEFALFHGILSRAHVKSNKEIATVRDRSEETVKRQLGFIFRKLGVENRTSAIAVARERQLL